MHTVRLAHCPFKLHHALSERPDPSTNDHARPMYHASYPLISSPPGSCLLTFHYVSNHVPVLPSFLVLRVCSDSTESPPPISDLPPLLFFSLPRFRPATSHLANNGSAPLMLQALVLLELGCLARCCGGLSSAIPELPSTLQQAEFKLLLQVH